MNGFYNCYLHSFVEVEFATKLNIGENILNFAQSHNPCAAEYRFIRIGTIRNRIKNHDSNHRLLRS